MTETAAADGLRNMPLPRTPVRLGRVVDDPDEVWRLIDAHAPYWPVQRYFANSAEYATLSGQDEPAQMIVAPVFRGNWAFDGDVLDGVQPILDSAAFVDAARQLFDAEIVRPTTVYVNLTWQLPFPQGAGHTDIPAFRGFDRTTYPITFLTIMGLSGLFEDVRVKVATGVSWFYGGPDGGFEYWPQGPDGPSAAARRRDRQHRDRRRQRLHVAPGAPDRPARGRHGHDVEGRRAGTPGRRRRRAGWAIVDGGEVLGSFITDQLRVSLSWKGIAFTDDADRRRHDDHLDDIDLAGVLRRFSDDFAARGVPLSIPSDPLSDPTVRPDAARRLRPLPDDERMTAGARCGSWAYRCCACAAPAAARADPFVGRDRCAPSGTKLHGVPGQQRLARPDR